MKILVPTDFSALSKVAVRYAAQLATSLEGSLTLFHVVHIDAPPRAMASVKAKSIEDAMEDTAHEDGLQLLAEVKSELENPPAMHLEIKRGYPLDELAGEYAAEYGFDLIIIGTHGASGLSGKLLGSNAARMISKSSLPVLSVPAHAVYRPLQRIVYATDLLNVEHEAKFIAVLARLFHADVHVVHVLKPGTTSDRNTGELEEQLRQTTGYARLAVRFVENEDVAEAIEQVDLEVKADILAMFPHESTFFDKLFGRSVTRQVAFHGTIPLLSLRQDS